MDGWLGGWTKAKHVSFHFSNIILLLPLNSLHQFFCSRIFIVCFSRALHLTEKLVCFQGVFETSKCYFAKYLVRVILKIYLGVFETTKCYFAKYSVRVILKICQGVFETTSGWNLFPKLNISTADPKVFSYYLFLKVLMNLKCSSSILFWNEYNSQERDSIKMFKNVLK